MVEIGAGGGSIARINKFLNINLVWNEGIAFGLLSFDKDHLYNLLTILIIVLIIGVS